MMQTPRGEMRAGTPRRATHPKTFGHQPQNWTGADIFLTSTSAVTLRRSARGRRRCGVGGQFRGLWQWRVRACWSCGLVLFPSGVLTMRGHFSFARAFCYPLSVVQGTSAVYIALPAPHNAVGCPLFFLPR